MDNFRKSLIEELMLTLKIPQGNFNFGTIADELNHIPNEKLKEFYRAVMSAEGFGNGMKSIIVTAEKFKPVFIDDTEAKAKELVLLVETLNTKIGEDAKRMGEDFIRLVNCVRLPTVSQEDIAILDNVKPHYNHKSLIINIRHYQTSIDTLNAFKNAITRIKSYSSAIESPRMKKLMQRATA